MSHLKAVLLGVFLTLLPATAQDVEVKASDVVDWQTLKAFVEAAKGVLRTTPQALPRVYKNSDKKGFGSKAPSTYLS